MHYQRAEKKRFLQAAAIRRFLHARTWPLVELLSLPDVKNINFPKVTLMLLEPDKRWPGQSAPESSQPPPPPIDPPRYTSNTLPTPTHASNIHNKFPPYTVKLREYALSTRERKKRNQVSLHEKGAKRRKNPLARPILRNENSKDSLRFYE